MRRRATHPRLPSHSPHHGKKKSIPYGHCYVESTLYMHSRPPPAAWITRDTCPSNKNWRRATKVLNIRFSRLLSFKIQDTVEHTSFVFAAAPNVVLNRKPRETPWYPGLYVLRKHTHQEGRPRSHTSFKVVHPHTMHGQATAALGKSNHARAQPRPSDRKKPVLLSATAHAWELRVYCPCVTTAMLPSA